jgi:signal peptidase
MSAPSSTEREESARPHPVRRVYGALLGLVVLIAVVVAAAVAVVPAAVGGEALTVLSGSMEPTLPLGSVVVVRPRPAAEITSGVVIAFTDRSRETGVARTVTHRVIEVEHGPDGPTFRTKGDANEDPDEHATTPADVIGVAWYDVPLVGWVREAVTSRIGLLYAGGALLLLLAAHLLLPRTTSRRRSAGS